jgi:hypothetical protein
LHFARWFVILRESFAFSVILTLSPERSEGTEGEESHRLRINSATEGAERDSSPFGLRMTKVELRMTKVELRMTKVELRMTKVGIRMTEMEFLLSE